MSISYSRLSQFQQIFLRATGVSKDIFDQIFIKLIPMWEETTIGRYKRIGRPFKLSLEDIMLMTLMYYRSYVSQKWLGFLFNIDDANVSRLIRKIEPLLATLMTIDKSRTMTEREIQECIIDASEQKVQRPSKSSSDNQKDYYSGKKKQHTIKTEIDVKLDGEIVHVSDSVPGATHDFALHKAQRYPEEVHLFADSGYQGIQSIHTFTEFPFKASKNKHLDDGAKEYNTALSRIRVKVEHIWGDIKIFGIMKNVYRNSRKTYNQKLRVIAGLVNMRNGFAMI